MPLPRESGDLVRAARLYFVEGWSQGEVADALQTTRSNVSRMLTAARQREIVQFYIHEPSDRDLELERRLTDRFGFSEVLVSKASLDEATSPAGALGALWLSRQLRDGLTVTLSWGAALLNLVAAVQPDHRFDVELAQMVGGLSPLDAGPTGHQVLGELAARIGGRCRYLHTPALLDHTESVAVLAEQPAVVETLQAAKAADVALVDISSFGRGSSRVLLERIGASSTEGLKLKRAGLAGSIGGRFYRPDGTAYQGQANDRVLGLDLESLRNKRSVLGIATGADEAPGVIGAARGGLITILCCDAAVARAVLHSGGNG